MDSFAIFKPSAAMSICRSSSLSELIAIWSDEDISLEISEICLETFLETYAQGKNSVIEASDIPY